jgi:hypothetical protein
MNDNMQLLIIMAGIAIYQRFGTVQAVSYMQRNGMTTNEAFNVIEAWEKTDETVASGRLS